jgi:hypothetical protein
MGLRYQHQRLIRFEMKWETNLLMQPLALAPGIIFTSNPMCARTKPRTKEHAHYQI